MDEQRQFNGGYLFLQDIYLNDILSRHIYTRILYPSSKKSSFEESKRFIEQPSFELYDIYRALSVMAEESDYIQSHLFKNSASKGKEIRPLPIVRMGLFMDEDSIPISFSIFPGNRNEQMTMMPLEEEMFENFDMSKFVVLGRSMGWFQEEV